MPGHHRLRRSAQFQQAVRHGVRAARRHVVVHVAQSESVDQALVGFVVSKSVGNAVVRHRVTRQLRHVMAARIDQLPHNCLLVIRATPAAANADFDQLCADVDAGLSRVLQQVNQ